MIFFSSGDKATTVTFSEDIVASLVFSLFVGVGVGAVIVGKTCRICDKDQKRKSDSSRRDQDSGRLSMTLDGKWAGAMCSDVRRK